MSPIYLTGAIGALLPQGIGAHLTMVPFLADQLLFGAANLTLLWIPASYSQQQLRDMALRDPLIAAEQIRFRAGRGEAGLPAWTLSVGAARIEAGDRSIDDVIHRADLLTYRAKDLGRAPPAA